MVATGRTGSRKSRCRPTRDISAGRFGRFVGKPAAERAVRLCSEAALLAEAEDEIAEGKAIAGAPLAGFLAWFVSDGDDARPAAKRFGQR